MKHCIKECSSELVFSIFCVALGMFSGYLGHAEDSSWYMGLNKPIFNPPSWMFAPVWTILYILIGITFGRLWKQRSRNRFVLHLFTLQFVFNLCWSVFFFRYQSPGLALFDICMLWVCLVIFMILIRDQAGMLLLCLPYLLWVSFALVLNATLYTMNI